jgi:hypothetical protein
MTGAAVKIIVMSDIRRGADPLHEPGQQQDIHAARRGGDDAGDHKYAEADVQDGQAAEAVRKEPRRNLPAGHADHEYADDLLRARQGRCKRVDHGGNCGQAHVHGDSRRRGQ